MFCLLFVKSICYNIFGDLYKIEILKYSLDREILCQSNEETEGRRRTTT